MSRYRKRLPQLGGGLFLAEAGLEPTLAQAQAQGQAQGQGRGAEPAAGAAFVLLQEAAGRQALLAYFEGLVRLARARRSGLVLDTPTRHAHPDRGRALGYTALALAAANRAAVALLASLRAAWEAPGQPPGAGPIVISGAIGPRADGYRIDARMGAAAARDYHLAQVAAFAASEADMVSACALGYPDEAIGIVDAAAACEMPVAVSFTLGADGRLPCGDTLAEAIARTDLETGAWAAYYMADYAHPDQVAQALAEPGAWRARLRGLRADAARRSHADPDASAGLGDDYLALCTLLPHLNVVGCCATDERHVAALAHNLSGVGWPAPP